MAGSKDINNVITASKGSSTVWGGGISDDTLVAGSGVDTFYYMRGNGRDVIRGAGKSDIVNLDGVTMSDITSTDVSNSSVVLNFADGGTLTLNTNSGTKFQLEGATYTTDKSGNWTKA